MKPQSLIFLLLIASATLMGCGGSGDHPKITDPEPTPKPKVVDNKKGSVFENKETFTMNDCAVNELPETAFSIEYPDGFSAAKYAMLTSNTYLTLTYKEGEDVKFFITVAPFFGIREHDKAIKQMELVEEVLANNPEVAYKNSFFGVGDVYGRTYPHMEYEIRGDFYEIPGFTGEYYARTIAMIPKNPDIEGVAFSVYSAKVDGASRKETEELGMQIFNTLRFTGE